MTRPQKTTRPSRAVTWREAVQSQATDLEATRIALDRAIRAACERHRDLAKGAHAPTAEDLAPFLVLWDAVSALVQQAQYSELNFAYEVMPGAKSALADALKELDQKKTSQAISQRIKRHLQPTREVRRKATQEAVIALRKISDGLMGIKR